MPSNFQSQFDSASVFLNSNDFSSARGIYEQILVKDPDNFRALHALGVVLFRGWGEARQAVRLIRRALALNNGFAEAYNNLGKIFQERRRISAAIACYRRAVSVDPGNHIAWINLGTVYRLEKKSEDALAAFRDAIRIAPENFEAIFGIARALIQMKRFSESLDYLARAQDMSPSDSSVYYSLAFAHKQLDHFALARDYLQIALELNPDYADAYRGLAEVLLPLGDADGAVEAARKALRLKPDFRDAHTFLLFALHYPAASTQKDLYDATIEFCERFCKDIPRISNHSNDRSPDRQLRIGYISGEFNRHPVGFFFEQAIAYHDHSQVTTYCYSNGPETDWLTERLKTYADFWRNIAGLSDESVIRQIEQDQIDILVDLSGHIGFGRIDLMARKPAPVQVSWIGYYNTSGLDTVDYILMDSETVTTEMLPWFTERVVYMPESRFCYTPPPDFFEVKPLPALRNGFVTFGCFNNISKISPETISMWSEILARMPDSILVLKWSSFKDESVVERFNAMFRQHGISADRIEYRMNSDYGTLLGEYGDIDIALDPYPFSGATTSCEALWMGVPVVTTPGPLPAGRQTLALLKLIGLHDFIAESKEAYVELALSHAADPDKLASLRPRIREMMAMSPLCDGRRFATELMSAYRMMWRRWCAGTAALDKDRTPIQILPAVPEIAYNRGVACLSEKRWHEAKTLFHHAITVNPDFPEAFNNLGIVMYHLGELPEAERSLEKAVSLRPDFIEALNNLGRVFTAQKKRNKAFSCFSRVLELDSTHHQAWNNLGELHLRVGHIAKARACFRKSVRYCPDFMDAHNNLALLTLNFNARAGYKAFRSLVERYPDNLDVHSNLIFAMHYIEDISRGKIFSETCRMSDKYYNCDEARIPAQQPLIIQSDNRPLKVGFVSADFHQHPGGVFFQALARHHDKSKFTFFCYYNSGKRDIITDDIYRYVANFRCVAGTTDEELINLIHSDEIDILVDLSGYTSGNRLSVFARKTAPVQASWLGWFNTTCIKAMEYMIADPLMVQSGENNFFSERIVYLPHSRFCYTPPFLCPDVEELPALSSGCVTFGCFNNIAKITDKVVSVWAAILRRATGSRLVLKSPYFRDYEMRKRFIRRFEAHGISENQIELRSDSLHFFMMTEYGDIDIALDPFPYCGGLTSCESLWMGVPVVTLPGDLPVSRQTESFLKDIGIEGFIARSEQEYIDIACDWAGNIEYLSRLRAEIRTRMSHSSICDGKLFSDDFGNVLSRIWSEHMEQK